MKKLLIFLSALMLFFGTAGMVFALTFSSVVDFEGSDPYPPYGTYLQLYDNSNADPNYQYTHEVVFAPPAAEIISAELVLLHGFSTHSVEVTEVWEVWAFVNSNDPDESPVMYYLDDLVSSMHAPVEQTFILPEILFDGVTGGMWEIEFRLQEMTEGVDHINIFESTLSGTYAPVPEPTTMLLLGAGLVGLVGFRRKKFKK